MMATKIITVRRDVASKDKADAALARKQLASQGTLVVNLLSSPGAGKTTLLEGTARRLGQHHRLAVLVGDLETERDAERLSPLVPTAQLTTGGACHLELSLVQRGLQALGNPKLDFLFIENVGNLVCPASHDLGEHLRVVLISTTEGDDKPGKYPKMFRTSQTMLITKIDLLPHVPFSVEGVTEDARLIQPDLNVLSVCALDNTGMDNTGMDNTGMDSWCEHLLNARSELLSTSIAGG